MNTSYEVVTICGSMTLFDNMLMVAAEEEANGRLVLAPFPVHIPNEGRTAFLQMLDELHRRKIDLSDGIVVVTQGGRIGESTRGEIEYAERTGKTVRYAEDPAGWVDYPAASSADGWRLSGKLMDMTTRPRPGKEWAVKHPDFTLVPQTENPARWTQKKIPGSVLVRWDKETETWQQVEGVA